MKKPKLKSLKYVILCHNKNTEQQKNAALRCGPNQNILSDCGGDIINCSSKELSLFQMEVSSSIQSRKWFTPRMGIY